MFMLILILCSDAFSNLPASKIMYCFEFRVDDIYKFLHIWVPHLYGDLEDMDYKARGFELVESDTELWDEEPGGESQGEGGRRGSDEGELAEMTRESWEVSVPLHFLFSVW